MFFFFYSHDAKLTQTWMWNSLLTFFFSFFFFFFFFLSFLSSSLSEEEPASCCKTQKSLFHNINVSLDVWLRNVLHRRMVTQPDYLLLLLLFLHLLLLVLLLPSFSLIVAQVAVRGCLCSSCWTENNITPETTACNLTCEREQSTYQPAQRTDCLLLSL